MTSGLTLVADFSINHDNSGILLILMNSPIHIFMCYYISATPSSDVLLSSIALHSAPNKPFHREM